MWNALKRKGFSFWKASRHVIKLAFGWLKTSNICQTVQFWNSECFSHPSPIPLTAWSPVCSWVFQLKCVKPHHVLGGTGTRPQLSFGGLRGGTKRWDENKHVFFLKMFFPEWTISIACLTCAWNYSFGKGANNYVAVCDINWQPVHFCVLMISSVKSLLSCVWVWEFRSVLCVLLEVLELPVCLCSLMEHVSLLSVESRKDIITSQAVPQQPALRWLKTTKYVQDS